MGKGSRFTSARFAALALLPLLAASLGMSAPGAAAASTTKYYFHGSSQDDVNRTGTLPGATTATATFNTTAPTGTSDATQTGTDPVANESVGSNPFMPYWQSTNATGVFNGTFHFDWWWTSNNPEVAAGIQDQVDIGVYADGNLISDDANGQPAVVTVDLNPGIGGTPAENTADVPVNGAAVHTLVIQVRGHFSDTSTSDTVHYDSTSAPSSFTAPTPAPLPPTVESSAPCTTLCFSPPVALPQSDYTGSTSATCYSTCGEPSLAVSPVDGTLYVSTPRTILVCCNSQASPVWKSGDNGATWSAPIFPSGAENATTGGDTEMAVDKRGTLYEGELWLGSDSIYISPDKGNSWSWSPASHDVGADREWFAYAPAEDALYGFYDGFKGLMVVKAPLTTPLGSSTAQFFPIERVAVPECAAGLAVNCPSLPADSVGGTPILDGTVSPGRPSVSPVDGTVYFPFPYQVPGQGIGIASTSDGGQSFSYSYVKGAGGGNLGDTGNDFPVSAVDSAGRLYIAWVEKKDDGFAVYLASSGDKGATWTTPVEVSKGISRTALFPNIVAGTAGQVAVSWYGTSVLGDPNTVPASTQWTVYVSETADATDASPTFQNGIVQSNFHTGVICTMGANCTGNTRELLDFFDMKLDRQGNLGVVYTRDLNAGTQIAYARQSGGCILAQPCSPGVVPEAPAAGGLVLGGAFIAAVTVPLVRRRRKRGMPQALPA